MQGIFRTIGEFIKKADMLLLSLCVTATIYGIVIISSATNYAGNSRYVLIQLVALLLGIALYVLFTLIDVDIIAERRELLLVFSVFSSPCFASSALSAAATKAGSISVCRS